MNLVEISETLKGVPDTYLVKHVQTPDGSVPQYLALAELQRRQDMRARFTQQAQPSTVAEDTAQASMAGISAGLPAQPAAPPAGFSRGGLVEDYISRAAKFESGGNRNAKNPYSSASGRFQLIDATRKRLDETYGFDPKDRSDETEMKRMQAYTGETVRALNKAGIPVTGGTLYGGHFLGQKGVTDFFKAYQADPTMGVEKHFSAEIIRKNPAIFNPRGGQPRRTLADIMQKFERVGGQQAPSAPPAPVAMAEQDSKISKLMALESLLGDSPKPQTFSNPIVSQLMQPQSDPIRDRLLAQYTLPGIMGGVPGYADGGPVRTTANSYMSSPPPMQNNWYYDENGRLVYRDPNARPMPTIGDVIYDATFKPSGNDPYAEFSGPGPTGGLKISAPDVKLPRPKAFAGIPKTDVGESGREFADAADWFSENMMKPGAKAIMPAATEKDFMSLDKPWIAAVPYNVGVAGLDVAKSIGGAGIAGLGALGTGASTLLHGAFGQGPTVERPSAATPAAVAQQKLDPRFFYNPKASGAPTGGGMLGEIQIPRIDPSRSDAGGVAPPPGADGGAPPAPPPGPAATPPGGTPPQSPIDNVVNEFLAELKASRMSKDEMRQTALLQAGLGMMAGQSPNFATNVGQGAMAGLQAYQQAKAQNQAIASEAFKNMMAARALNMDIQRLALENRRVGIEEGAAKDRARIAEGELTYKNQLLAIEVAKAATESGGKLSAEDVTKMINNKLELARKEQANALSPYHGKTDIEIEAMVRKDFNIALNMAQLLLSGPAAQPKKMGSAL